ncbi:MAG: hypothetical protein RLZZ436_306 [Planctomycetota bacterium]
MGAGQWHWLSGKTQCREGEAPAEPHPCRERFFDPHCAAKRWQTLTARTSVQRLGWSLAVPSLHPSFHRISEKAKAIGLPPGGSLALFEGAFCAVVEPRGVDRPAALNTPNRILSIPYRSASFLHLRFVLPACVRCESHFYRTPAMVVRGAGGLLKFLPVSSA